MLLKGTEMDTIIDLIFPLLPALLVFLAAYIFFNRMRADQRGFYTLLMRMEERKHSLPLQLKAYERMIIMLERIKPGVMVMRLKRSSDRASSLHLEMLKAVREEFEHNVSMQMYLSRSAWEMTKQAVDDSKQLINKAAQRAGAEASAMEFSKEVFVLEEQSNNQAIEQALELLRNEARKMM